MLHHEERLQNVDERLRKIFQEAGKTKDILIIYGHRGQEDQDQAYATGHSKFKFPDSDHNKTPSLAVDAAPLPLDWENSAAFSDLYDFLHEIAERLGLDISWGGHYATLKDLDHFYISLKSI